MVNRVSESDWVIIYVDDLGERPSRAVEIDLARGTHAGRGVILDLGAVRCIDSSGIGLLFSMKKELEDHGRVLLLSNLKKVVLESIQMVHMERVFPVYPDVNAALRHPAPLRAD